ncbi:MAG: hypothetical protein ACRCXB_28540 [Aeromonadaceae bacterium]
MKNADMPATPAGVQLANDDPQFDFHPHGVMQCIGLTKREMMAMCAMQGLVSAGGYDKFAYLATDAVNIADALLAELEATKDNK